MTRLCECGCGQPTALAQRTNRQYGHVKGQPLRFVNGHNRGAPPAVPYARRARFTPAHGPLSTNCWRPAQKLDRTGYVRVSDRGVGRFAHVVMWEDRNGPKPAGLELDHLCRNRWCANPDHLEPVTRAVNIQRGLTAKLNREAVREIRQSNELLRVLAARYDVSITTVWMARRGDSWAEPDPTAGTVS